MWFKMLYYGHGLSNSLGLLLINVNNSKTYFILHIEHNFTPRIDDKTF